jgi:hypothetical protein
MDTLSSFLQSRADLRSFIAFLCSVCVGASMVGCRISRHVEETQIPPDQPPLRQLEAHLDYHDPDAGQPDYVRTGDDND